MDNIKAEREAFAGYDGSQASVKAMQARLLEDLQRELNKTEARAKVPSAGQYAQQRLFIMLMIGARLKQHYSQRQLAAKAGLSQSVVARIESGKGNPSLATLLKITEALGVNIVLE